MEDGNPVRPRRAHVGDRVLDRGRDDHRIQVRADAAPILGDDAHARALEGLADRGRAAAVEGAVAPRRAPAAQRLELGQGAHAAARDAGVEEVALARAAGSCRRGSRLLGAAHDHHRIAGRDAIVELDHVPVR